MLERHISNCFLKPPIAITWPILLSLQGVPRKIANSPVAIFCFPNMHQVGAPFSHHIRRLKHIKSYWPMNSHHITIKYIKWSLSSCWRTSAFHPKRMASHPSSCRREAAYQCLLHSAHAILNLVPALHGRPWQSLDAPSKRWSSMYLCIYI